MNDRAVYACISTSLMKLLCWSFPNGRIMAAYTALTELQMPPVPTSIISLLCHHDGITITALHDSSCCAETTIANRVVWRQFYSRGSTVADVYLHSSSLKTCCPHGVFMSLSPGDPTLWSGVIFVRKGPYAPSILRFQISFPPTYPTLPPLVTFSTDIFHPLITPLTTYMYTTDIQNTGTVSATDEERLPPGGFSLRHGFPKWFGRASRRVAERTRPRVSGDSLQTPARGSQSGSDLASPESGTASSYSPTPGTNEGRSRLLNVGIYEVLRYIRSTFDDDEVLDKVPLEAAGNPGAWNAWRTHRIKLGKIQPAVEVKERGAWHDGLSEDSSTGAQKVMAGGTSTPMMTRRPGEWNWEGVWEIRVKKGIEGSVSEAVLYGSLPGDDLIRFLHMQTAEVETIKENIKRSVEALGESPRKSMGG